MKEINIRTLEKNMITMIAEEKALLTAGTPDGANTMTVNWGGMGYLWHKNFCFIVVRKSRHTLQFIRDNKTFSLNFFGGERTEDLAYCGTVSGKNEDKFAHCGLEVDFAEGIPYIRQAHMVLTCKVLYTDDVEECNFVDKSIIDTWYRGAKHGDDPHELFIGEIVGAFDPRD